MELSKSHYGWVATTLVPVDDERMLQIFTMKRHSGELVTTASAGVKSGMFFSFKLTEDYRKTFARVNCKCTKNAVITQHNMVVSDLATIIADVKSFYNKQVEPA